MVCNEQNIWTFLVLGEILASYEEAFKSVMFCELFWYNFDIIQWKTMRLDNNCLCPLGQFQAAVNTRSVIIRIYYIITLDGQQQQQQLYLICLQTDIEFLAADIKPN